MARRPDVRTLYYYYIAQLQIVVQFRDGDRRSTDEYDAFLADDAEELFAAFYETLDLPLDSRHWRPIQKA